MKTRFFSHTAWASIALVLVILLSAAAPVAAEYTIVRLEPGAPTVSVGQVVAVSIRIDNVAGLFGAEVHLSYNPAIVEVLDSDSAQAGTQIAPGSLLKPDFVAQNRVDAVYGTIDFGVIQLPPSSPVNGSGVLATITFRGKAPGTSQLSFNTVNLSTPSSAAIPASSQNGQLTVSGLSVAPTPTPYLYPTTSPPQTNYAYVLGYHTVRAGETLYCIGRAYGVSPWAIANQNGLRYPYTLWVGQVLAIPNVAWTGITPGPVCQPQFGGGSPLPPLPPAPTPVPAPTYGTWYQVQLYDTLDSIAARFGVTTYAIMQANNLSSPYSIYVGQWLYIPAGGYYYPPPTPTPTPAYGTWYQVQPYDTLDSIAARFGVTTYAIMQANNLSSPYVYTGQWLFIPTTPYSPPSTLPPVPGPYPGEAWLGQYFNNMYLGGSPDVQHMDPAIDFDWKEGSPFPGQIDKNFFSVRWTRNVYFEGGTYRFWAWVDDGVRLYVDDIVVVNEWHDQSGKFFGDATLAPGTHAVKVEYYENAYTAMISVWWERLR